MSVGTRSRNLIGSQEKNSYFLPAQVHLKGCHDYNIFVLLTSISEHIVVRNGMYLQVEIMDRETLHDDQHREKHAGLMVELQVI